MHNNYYFLRQLSIQLRKELVNTQLLECFSQSKDELILGFASENAQLHIRAILTSQFSALSFPADFKRSNKNSINLFSELIGQKVLDVVQNLNERSFYLQLENNYQLLFKLFGNRSNIVLFKNNKAEEIFNHNLPKDIELAIDQLNRELDFSEESLQKNNYLLPTFGKVITAELERRTTLPGKRQQEFYQLINYLENPVYYIGTHEEEGEVALSLFTLKHMLHTTGNPLEAANLFVKEFLREHSFLKEKRDAITFIEKKKIKTEYYIQDLYDKLKGLHEATSPEQLADIIMANLHAIPAHKDSVELFNFYKDEPITIALKKNLSPQKTAENYYRKGKNRKIELQKLEETIAAKTEEHHNLNTQLYALSQITDHKELRKYIKDINLFPQKKEESAEELFKKFVFEGFEILVRRNAKNNDTLTQKYAYKEDLWLHAKDVAGSHVVIKFQAGKKFPKTVIEKAAQLAAWYSKRKNESLCPVSYTPKKYVRKPKGAIAGAVIVEKESVIMVKPEELK